MEKKLALINELKEIQNLARQRQEFFKGVVDGTIPHPSEEEMLADIDLAKRTGERILEISKELKLLENEGVVLH